MNAASAAIHEARAAQRTWADVPLPERLAVIRRFRRILARDPDRFAAAVTIPQRASIAETLSAEVLPLADACRFLERDAARVLAPRRLGRRGRPAWLAGIVAEVRREPLGVVLVIGPSNYPLFLPGVQALQALAAGNAAVLKPGRLGAGPARALSESLVRSGLDPRLAPVLEEDPRAAREAIDAGVDKVVLTGSAATGASLLGELAPRGIPAVVELSGCDAVFVLEDADLERAARALAFGLGLNGGATCIAPRRVFVARSRASDLERLLVARAERLPPRAVDPGPAALLARLGGEAIRSGARVAAGSLDPAPSMRPVVLADAQPSMGLLREDVFAPVISLVAVDGPEQALAAAGACPYALGASIFGSERTARELAARVQAGFVTINDLIVPTADPRLPFGGRRRSGFGVTRGGEGLLEMTAVKAISARRGRLAPHLDGARDSDAGLFRAWLRAAHGRGARERFAGLVSLVRAAAARPGTRRDTEGHRR